MTATPPLALLAGGLATRMRPLTERVPKSLLEVAGEPFVAHQLRLFRREGITRIVICVGHLGEMVRDFVGDGSAYGLDVVYSFDGDRLLGTGGALKRALPLLEEEFWICYGDSYLDISYQPVLDLFQRLSCAGVMTIYRNDGQHDVSNVEFADGMIRRYSKTQLVSSMKYIDWGLAILRKSALSGYPINKKFELATVYEDLVGARSLAAFEVHQRFYEIGSQQGLADTAAWIANRAKSV